MPLVFRGSAANLVRLTITQVARLTSLANCILHSTDLCSQSLIGVIMRQSLARQELAGLMECTLRTADATGGDVEHVCRLARENRFHSVCVNSSRLVQAHHYLEDSGVKLTCAVGFPLGAADSDAKRYETELAVDSGADFIELSANLGLLRDGNNPLLLRELLDVVEAAEQRPVSVHCDFGLASSQELQVLAHLASEAGAKGIAILASESLAKNVDAIRQLRDAAPNLGLKVDQTDFRLADIISLLELGVTRFGVVDAEQLLKLVG